MSSKRPRDETSAATIHKLPPTVTEADLECEEGEEIRLRVPRVALHLGEFDAGVGEMLVTTTRIAWRSSDNKERGYAIRYRSIALHAVCRDADAYSAPCIYCQLVTDDDAAGGSDEAEEDLSSGGSSSSSAAGSLERQREDAELQRASELRFTPGDATVLDDLFREFSACAQLHPDPVDDDEDGGLAAAFMGGGGGWFTSESSSEGADGGLPMSAAQLEAMADLESRFVGQPQGGLDGGAQGQFDDAEEEGEGEEEEAGAEEDSGGAPTS